MRLAAVSRASVFGIVGIAWVIVFATPEYGVPWLAGGALLLVLAWRSRGHWLRAGGARRLWRGVAAVTLLALPLDILFLSQGLLHAVIHVALVAQVLLLFEASTPRLHRLLILLSLFDVLAATQLTQRLQFAPLFLAYAGMAVVALTFLHLVETAARAKAVGAAPDLGDLADLRLDAPRPLGLALLIAGLAVVPIVVLLFLTLPRSDYSFLSAPGGTSQAERALRQLGQARKQTGFSDRVELGDYGRVQEDPTVVMRVRFPGGLPEALRGRDLYWRAGAMDAYDGYGWTASRPRFAYYAGGGRSGPTDQSAWMLTNARGRLMPTFGTTFLVSSYFQSHEVRSPESLRADPELVEHDVFLELPYADSLIGLQSVMAVEGVFARGLSIDMNQGLRIESRAAMAEKVSYTAFSLPPPPDVRALGGVPMSDYAQLFGHGYLGPFYRQFYLQLPRNLTGDVRSLVADLTAGEETADGRVVALLDYFNDFRYSLDTQRVSLSAVPLDEFLFTTREGYCEHFATAMVVMLRVAGLPARLANGFRGGVWNAPGQFYAIRQADAHTWAEVWLPGHGWIPVDPAPGGGAPEPWVLPEQNSYVVYAQAFWQERVLGYNTGDQTRIVTVARDWLRAQPGVLWTGLVRIVTWALRVMLQWITLLAPVAMAGVLFGLYVWRNGLPGGVVPLPGARGPRVPFYFEMLRSLRRVGLEKRDTDPPRLFAERVRRTRSDLAPGVLALTRQYERVRFGGIALTREESVEVRATLRRLRQRCRTAGDTATVR